MNAIQHLENVIENGSSFSIGDSLSQGFDIWKGNIGDFIGMMVVYMLIVMGIGLVPLAGQIVSSILVSPALLLGGVICSYLMHYRQPSDFSNFFDGFANWKDIVIINLIIYGLSILFLIPIIFVIGFQFFDFAGDSFISNEYMFDDISTTAIIGIFAVAFAFAFVILNLSQAIYINHFYKISPLKSLKYSWRIVIRQWFKVLLYLFLMSIICSLGLIALIIGVIVTISMIFPMTFSLFKNITHLDDYIDQNPYDGMTSEVTY